MSENPKIEERENGPLIAKHITSIKGSGKEPIEAKELMALCRCGLSKNKPFCDGSHNDGGFTSENTKEAAGDDRIVRFEGSEVTVVYNPRICSHAGYCVMNKSDAFVKGRKPWCEPDAAPSETIESIVKACPSGALSMGRKDGDEHLINQAKPQIVIEKNGPYRVIGVEIDQDIPGLGGTKEKFVLCRCGLSGNKPYCDGSHYDEGWKDD